MNNQTPKLLQPLLVVCLTLIICTINSSGQITYSTLALFEQLQDNRANCVMNSQKKDYESAIKYCTAAIKAALEINPNPNNGKMNEAFMWKLEDAFYFRAEAYREQEKYKLAVADYTQLIKIIPKSSQRRSAFYWERAFCYRVLEDLNSAVSDLTAYIELKPRERGGYNQRAEIYIQQKKYDLAVADLNTSINFNTPIRNYLDKNELIDSYRRRFYILKEQKKYDPALADVNKVIELAQPTETLEDRFFRAEIYLELNKPDEALVDLNNVIGNLPPPAKPEYAEVYFLRGYVQGAQKKYELAIADYSKVVELTPDNLEARYWRGFNYYQQNKFDLAIIDANHLIQKQPTVGVSYALRAAAYCGQGKKTEALADEKKAVELKAELIKKCQ